MLADTPDEPTWLNERMVPAEVNKLELSQGKYEKYCETVHNRLFHICLHGSDKVGLARTLYVL